jgi:pSer/pThr/pTyr-binding forkhead associated (FHA) protein
MPVIEVYFNGKKIKDHSLIIGEGCNIGRKKGNDIVIDNLAVSGSHARIESVSTAFVLKDLESTNGTIVNDKKITKHSLKHNDTILIGKHKLIFDCSDLQNMQSNESELSDEKTRILDVNDLREIAGWTKNEAPYEWYSRSNIPHTDEQKNVSFIAKVFQKFFG